MSISKKIAKLRKELKLTTEEFGKNLGVTGRMVARWENNTSTPSDAQIDKIKNIYGIDLREVPKKKEVIKKEIVKKEEIEKDLPKKENYSLDKNDSKGLKTLSKIISIFAKILKVLLIIAIPFLVVLMIIVPFIIKNIEIGDNYLTYKNPSGEILTIQGEDFSLSGKYTIKYKDEITTGEIKYDLLGEIAKTIKNMDNTKIIVFAEVSLVLTIASVVLEIVFFTYLSKLFKNISEKTPFTLQNADFLKKMTYILIFNIVIEILLNFLSKLFINVEMSNNYGFNSIIVMMVFACLSHIFRYGYNLQQNTNSDIY